MKTAQLLSYYATLHDTVCGRFPNENIFHPQYLISAPHRRALREQLAPLRNKRVLDVGCGGQPYRQLLDSSCDYVGIDVVAVHPETITFVPGERWPVDGPFDVVICTQVAEHVRDTDVFVRELDRVLADGGSLLVSVPFIYPVHDAHDYRRLTPDGVARLFPRMTLEHAARLGGVGSTVAVLMNTWIDAALSFTFARRALKGLIFFPRLPLSAALNLGAQVVDQLDDTARYFHNTFVVMKKPVDSPRS